MLNEVYSDVSNQIDQQRDLGIQITRVNDVPEEGPTNKGVWKQIPDVSVVFVDMKSSTALNSFENVQDAALIYTYFVRAMAVIFERFSAKYVDIQGDGLFGLFSGKGSLFEATACAITMKTYIAKELSSRIDSEKSVEWELTAGIGIDKGRLLVRRLGLRGVKQNEVWAGTPVNIAAKLSSIAKPNELAVSARVFEAFNNANKLRRRAIIWSCGCDNGDSLGIGLDAEAATTHCLWTKESAPKDLGLDFEYLHKLESKWCDVHGSEFCEAIMTGKRNRG